MSGQSAANRKLSGYGKKPVPRPSIDPWNVAKAGATTVTATGGTAGSSALPGLATGAKPEPAQRRPSTRRGSSRRVATKARELLGNGAPSAKRSLLALFSASAELELPIVVEVDGDAECDVVSLVRATVKKGGLCNGSDTKHRLEAGSDSQSGVKSSAEQPVTHVTVSPVSECRTLASGLRLVVLSAAVESEDIIIELASTVQGTATPIPGPYSAWTKYKAASKGSNAFQEYFLYEMMTDEVNTGGGGGGGNSGGASSADTLSAIPGLTCPYDDDHVFHNLASLLDSPSGLLPAGLGQVEGFRYCHRLMAQRSTELPSGTVLPAGCELMVAANDESLAVLLCRGSTEQLDAAGGGDGGYGTCVPCWMLDSRDSVIAGRGYRRGVTFVAVPLYAPLPCVPSTTGHCMLMEYQQLVKCMVKQDVSVVRRHVMAYPLLQPGADLLEAFPSSTGIICQEEEFAERVVVSRHMSAICASELELLRLPLGAGVHVSTLPQSAIPVSLLSSACVYLARLAMPEGRVSGVSLPNRTAAVHVTTAFYSLPVDVVSGSGSGSGATSSSITSSTLPSSFKANSKSRKDTITATAAAAKSVPSSPALTRRASVDNALCRTSEGTDLASPSAGDLASVCSHSPRNLRSPSPSDETTERTEVLSSHSYDMLDDLAAQEPASTEPVEVKKKVKSGRSARSGNGSGGSGGGSFRSFNPSRLLSRRGEKNRASPTAAATTSWFASAGDSTAGASTKDGELNGDGKATINNAGCCTFQNTGTDTALPVGDAPRADAADVEVKVLRSGSLYSAALEAITSSDNQSKAGLSASRSTSCGSILKPATLPRSTAAKRKARAPLPASVKNEPVSAASTAEADLEYAYVQVPLPTLPRTVKDSKLGSTAAAALSSANAPTPVLVARAADTSRSSSPIQPPGVAEKAKPVPEACAYEIVPCHGSGDNKTVGRAPSVSEESKVASRPAVDVPAKHNAVLEEAVKRMSGQGQGTIGKSKATVSAIRSALPPPPLSPAQPEPTFELHAAGAGTGTGDMPEYEVVPCASKKTTTTASSTAAASSATPRTGAAAQDTPSTSSARPRRSSNTNATPVSYHGRPAPPIPATPAKPRKPSRRSPVGPAESVAAEPQTEVSVVKPISQLADTAERSTATGASDHGGGAREPGEARTSSAAGRHGTSSRKALLAAITARKKPHRDVNPAPEYSSVSEATAAATATVVDAQDDSMPGNLDEGYFAIGDLNIQQPDTKASVIPAHAANTSSGRVGVAGDKALPSSRGQAPSLASESVLGANPEPKPSRRRRGYHGGAGAQDASAVVQLEPPSSKRPTRPPPSAPQVATSPGGDVNTTHNDVTTVPGAGGGGGGGGSGGGGDCDGSLDDDQDMYAMIGQPQPQPATPSPTPSDGSSHSGQRPMTRHGSTATEFLQSMLSGVRRPSGPPGGKPLRDRTVSFTSFGPFVPASTTDGGQ